MKMQLVLPELTGAETVRRATKNDSPVLNLVNFFIFDNFEIHCNACTAL